MKKLLFISCFLYSLLGWGQIAFYNFQNTDSAIGVDSNISASNVSISSGSIVYQAGTDDGGTTIGNSGTWNTSNFSTTGKYLQFTISPNSGYSINFSEIRLRFGRTATGPQQVTVQYSLDAFATAGITMLSNGAVTSEDANNLSSFSITTGLPTSVTGTLTVRIWGHNASSTGNLRFNNFRVFGTVLPSAIQSVQTGNWSDSSTWVGGVVPGDGDNVQINNGHTVTTGARTRNSGTTTTVVAGGILAVTGTYTNNGTTTINGTFRIDEGGFATGNNFAYGANANLIYNHSNSNTYGPIDGNHNYWPASNGPTNVTLNNNSPINLGVARSIPNLFTSANFNGSNNITVTNTLQINSSVATFNNAVNYGSAATLIYNAGGTFGRGNEWNNNPANVLVQNNTTINYPNGWGNITRNLTGNLTINSGSSLFMDFGNPGIGVGTLTIQGNFTNNGNFSLGNQIGGDLVVGGNFTTASVINNNGRAVIFNGAANQTITRAGGGDVFFDYLIVNKNTGNVLLATDTNVVINTTTGEVLQINNTGNLDLNGRSLTLNNNGGNIQVNGSSTTRNITSGVTGAQLLITGSKTVTGSANLSIASNVTIILSGSLNPGNDKTTINGILRINPGGSCNGSGPVYSTSSTLEFNNHSTAHTVGTEWNTNNTTAGNGTPQTVILNNSSINMPGGARSVAGNITIGTGSTLNLNGSFGADLNVGGNWSNSGTLNANSRAVTFRGTNQSINGNTIFSFLTHNSSGSAGSNVLTINNNITVNNKLNLNNGLVTLASGVNVSIANNGTIAATSGNFNSATTNGTITFTGAGTTTGTVNFYPEVVQSPSSLQAVSYSANSRIHNTLTLNSNSFLTNAPSYADGSTLIYNSGGSYTRAVEWGNVASAFPTNGFPHHVRIQNGTTLNIESGLTGTLRLNGNLTLGNTGSAGSLNMQATSHDLEVRGNIILGSDSGTSTLTLSTSLGSDLFVAGNWNRTANGTLVNNSRLVEFNGTSLQTINDANTFDFLAINNAAGVNLSGTVVANQIIRLTNGYFTLGSANRIGDSSLINFNGGTFRTSASGAGFSDVVGAMNLTENSTLQLGTGDHNITFANSTVQTWTSGRVLTINGWTGTPTASGAGTAGKIQVGVGGLNSGQLDQIQFTGFDLGAVITASGELVPRDFPTFYSKGSLAPNLTTSWSRTTDGTGASPLNFTAGNTRYIIQNGHHMTTSAAWSITGANSILRILDGGTLQSTFAVTVPSTATFEIQDGGTYIHDNNSQPSTSILAGTELFSSNSNFEIRNWTNSSGNFDGCSNYGNININCTIDTGNSMNFLGSIQNIFGDLTINNSAIPLREVRLTASATNSTIIHGNLFINDGALVLTNSTGSSDLVVNQNFTQNNGSLILSSGNGFSSLVVNGNVNVIAGILRLHSNTTGVANFIVNGENFNLGQNVNISPSPSSATIPGNSGFYFNRNGVQNVSIGQAFVSGNYRDRFFYNASQTTINETYNGTVAQETVNGNGATPLTGYSAWPTSGDHLRNLTINNTAGVTLRNNRSINENLVLTNGTLTAATNTTLVFQGDQISRTNGSLNFAATGATLEMNNNTLKTFPTGLFSSSISNLHINGSGGVKANQDLNITNNLSLNQSNPNLTDGLLDMVIDYGSYATTANPDSTNPDNNLNSYTLNMVGNATTIGNGDVTGKIRRSGIVSGNTYTFGNKNMQLTFNGTNLPAYIEVVATKGNKGLHVDKDGIGDLLGTDVSPIGGAAVKRLYQIKRSGGDTPTTFTIRLPYNTDELNGNSENDLVIWDHHLPYNGVTPHEHGKTSLNTTERYIELAGHGIRYLALDGAVPSVGTFSTTKYWMVAEKETTDVLWLGAATDDWNIPSNWTSGSVPDFDTKIVIPQVPTYQNELQVEGTVEVASIDVKNNGSFVAKNNAVVQVKGGVLSNGGIGSWNNQGNFVAEPGSKIIFENPSATIAGNSKFHDLEVKNGGKLTIADNTVLEVVGNLVNFGELDANSTENTIRFLGTNQTIPATNGLGLAYRNIEINQIDESSEVTMTGSIEINGSLSIPSGKLKVENNTLTLRGAFPEEAQKIITTNQSRLEFRNSGTGTKVIPDFSSINDIVVDTNLQLEASANLDVHGNINVNKGTLNLGAFSWNRNSDGGTLSIGNQGKLVISGNNTLPSSFSVHDFDTDSEVAYVGGNQTIKKPTNTYGNLRLAGTGDKIFEESESLIEVSKDLLIEGGHLKVGEDKTLKVTNQFNNLSGLATFETGASLLQVNNVVNNGNITYKRTTGDLKNFDFVYWGTMVHNPLIKDMWMTNASETFYRFNPVTNNWVLLSGNTPMTPGIGYIARARFNPNWGSGPTPPSALPWTATYIARPNNGNVEVDIFQDKFHLIANPYPSALDAKEFIQQGGDFTSSPFLPTIFIWTQASGINNNQYQSSDYAAFNLFTETPDALNPSGYTVSRYVGAGQGFFVRTKNATMPNPAIATFTNNHRVAGNNVNFTKPGKNKNQTNSVVFMQKYWLKLSNSLGNTKQTAIVHHPEGSISYDPIQDSPAFNGNATLNLFSLSENQRMAVNVTSPIQITDEIPIGFTTTQPGSHSISLAHLENISESQDIYLLDQVLSVTHNIKQGPYTFTSIAGTFNERFKIVFQNQTLSTPEISTANWIVFAKENNIHIQSGNELIDQISIYDLNGRLLYQKQNVLDNELLVPWNASNQILLVKIIDINGISYKTKVLLP